MANALISKHSINTANLKACDNGPTAPVETNDTVECKALNRRVELGNSKDTRVAGCRT